MDILSKLTSIFSELLISFPEAEEVRRYADKRMSKEGQEIFQLGYFPNYENISILNNFIDDNSLIELGLVYEKIKQDGALLKKERHSTLENHNLIMPYKDAYGRIIGLVGRCLLSDVERRNKEIPKYKNTPFDKGLHLFGLSEAKKEIINKNYAILVEGQFDCMSAFDKGIKNIIALGSSSMTLEQAALISRYTTNLVLALDNDEAGIIGSEKIKKNFQNHFKFNEIKLSYPYKDIDEFIKENDANDLINLIS